MTTVGHGLMGLTIGTLGLPYGLGPRRLALTLGALAAAANLPDLPVPGWGHDRYDVSHSVFVNAALALLVVLAARLVPGLWGATGGGRAAACAVLAWHSHLLLDSFYNHGQGIAIFWPFSAGRLVLPLPWFSTLHGGWALDAHTLRVVAIELAAYGSLLALSVGLRAGLGPSGPWPMRRRSILRRALAILSARERAPR